MNVLQAIGINIETFYQQTMEYLSNTYMPVKSDLPDIPLSDIEIGNLAQGQSAAQNFADREFAHTGHVWQYDNAGNISHCDGVPIGRCVF